MSCGLIQPVYAGTDSHSHPYLLLCLDGRKFVQGGMERGDLAADHTDTFFFFFYLERDNSRLASPQKCGGGRVVLS